MSITIDVSPGELVDKITILEIKLERIDDPAKLANIRYEQAILLEILGRNIAPSAEIDVLRGELKILNETIWRVEEELREFERRKNFGAEFIEAARTVYFTNDRRADAKRRINELLGSRILEEKSHKAY